MLITVLAENSHIRAVGFEGEEIRFHASVQTEPRQTSDYYILMLTQLFTRASRAAATSCSACRAASRPASISARTSRSRWVRTA